MPTAQIAAELERSISATIMKAHELNISLRLKPKAGSRPPLITPPPRLQ
jgi:hypothetical protein